jgi:hypothetical protein
MTMPMTDNMTPVNKLLLKYVIANIHKTIITILALHFSIISTTGSRIADQISPALSHKAHNSTFDVNSEELSCPSRRPHISLPYPCEELVALFILSDLTSCSRFPHSSSFRSLKHGSRTIKPAYW